MHASRPRTRPKQWKRGGGQQRISEGVKSMRSPIARELFIRLLRMLVKLAMGCIQLTDVLTWRLLDLQLIHWCIEGCTHHGYVFSVLQRPNPSQIFERYLVVEPLHILGIHQTSLLGSLPFLTP